MLLNKKALKQSQRIIILFDSVYSNCFIIRIINNSNIIYIDRKNQIVVAITAHFKPMVFDRVEYIEKNIVEALID